MTSANEYQYPSNIDDTTFKVIPLPNAWVMDDSEITDEIFLALHKSFNDPTLSKTIKPDEVLEFGIGTVYPLPTKVCGVLPDTPILINNLHQYRDCNSTLPATTSSTSQFDLWFKLDFCVNSDSESCILTSCGNFSYSE